MTATPFLLLAAALFCLGLYGLLTRQNAVGLLLSIELMVNAANLNLVTFSRVHGSAAGQVFALFGFALTVAEVALGLALILVLFRRHKGTNMHAAQELRG